MGEHNPRDAAPPPWLHVLTRHVPDGEVAGYIALAGRGEPGYAIVKLPGDIDGPAITREAAGLAPDHPSVSALIADALSAHAAHARELEGALAEQTAFGEELRSERDQFAERERAANGAADALRADVERLKTETRRWRTRAAIAEGQLIRAGVIQPDSDQSGDDDPLTAFERKLADVEARLERATHNWKSAEKKSDAAWRRVGEIQSEFDAYREQPGARSAEQHRSSQLDQTEAVEASSVKLIGVRDQLKRCKQRCDELTEQLDQAEAKLNQAETANAVMETRLRAVETARAELAAELREASDTESS